MSIYLNEKDKLDIAILKDYSGKDETLKKLSELYNDVYDRFFKNDLLVIFAHPKMKKGWQIKQNIPAISQETIPWIAYIKTNTGNMPVRYCDSAVPQPNGGFKFTPSGFHITDQRWAYTRNDIDKVLVLMCTSHYRDGKIYIIDDKAAAEKTATLRSKSSSVAYHIFSEGGDLYNDEKKLNDFCLSWGIDIKGKFKDQKKNLLFDAIENAEKEHKKEYGYEAFNASITDNDPYFDIRLQVQDALNKGVIKFDKTKYVVTLQNGEVFCRIPIEKAETWKNVLFEYLGKNPDKYDTLMGSNDTAPVHELRKLEISEEINEEFIMSRDYPDLKIMVKEITGLGYKDLNKMKKPELQEKLVDYYITKGLKRP